MPRFASGAAIENLTTAERDAIVSPSVAVLIFNTTTSQFEYWEGTTWIPVVDTENLGSVSNHSDVDTITTMPIEGDSFVFDGTNWVPSSSSVDSSNNYVFSYKVTTQAIGIPINTWKDITFDINGQISGWTHTPGSSDFIVPATSLYAMTVEMNIEKSGSGSPQFAIHALLDGILVVGSHNGLDITSNNTTSQVSRTLLFNATLGQTLKIQVASDKSNCSIIPPPDPVGGGSPVSAALTIRRLT